MKKIINLKNLVNLSYFTGLTIFGILLLSLRIIGQILIIRDKVLGIELLSTRIYKDIYKDISRAFLIEIAYIQININRYRRNKERIINYSISFDIN